MKKIIYIMLVLIGATAISCDEEWMSDVVPTDKQKDKEAFNLVKDGRNALNGVFSLMQSEDFMGCNYVAYGDVRAADLRTNEEGKRMQGLYAYTTTSDAPESGMWTRPYKCLVSINNAIANIDNMVANTDVEEVYKQEIIANFYALRAFCHFELSKVFAGIPTWDGVDVDSEQSGICIADRVIAKDEKPPRATLKEVYTLIINDLTRAYNDMPADANTAGWFNKTAIRALQARVHLYNGDYDLAKTYAKEVISDDTYSLTPKDSYSDSWNQANTNTEDILKIINTATDNADREGIGYLLMKDGYNAIVPTVSFIDLLASDPNDVRNELIKDGYLYKYLDPYAYNIHIIRLSEMYLIVAETSLQTEEGKDAINAIISNRGGTEIVDKSDVTIERVLIERRKEFVGEGHVFFDYIRNNMDIVRTGDDHLGSLLPDFSGTISHLNPKLIQPIPRHELNVNKNIKQNTSY